MFCPLRTYLDLRHAVPGYGDGVNGASAGFTASRGAIREKGDHVMSAEPVVELRALSFFPWVTGPAE
eukprot:1802693-Prorocentrum_lima.AAC.1